MSRTEFHGQHRKAAVQQCLPSNLLPHCALHRIAQLAGDLGLQQQVIAAHVSLPRPERTAGRCRSTAVDLSDPALLLLTWCSHRWVTVQIVNATVKTT